MSQDDDATRILPRRAVASGVGLPMAEGLDEEATRQESPSRVKDATRRLTPEERARLSKAKAGAASSRLPMDGGLNAPLDEDFSVHDVKADLSDERAGHLGDAALDAELGGASLAAEREPVDPLEQLRAGYKPIAKDPLLLRLRGFVYEQVEWLPPWVGWAVAGVLFVFCFILALAGTGGGVDEKLLTGFFEQVHSGQFTQAEATLEKLEPSVQLEGHLRTYLDRGMKSTAREHRQRAQKLMRNKNYAEALAAARTATKLEPHADADMVVAEALRQLDDAEAATAYATFIERYPDDKRVDDAMFWRAESLVKRGELAAAKDVYNQIVALPRSRFKRSAQKRLKELP